MSAPTGGQGKKLVFIGDSGVGKTCIISRFLKGTFDDNQQTTDGASYASKSIDVNGKSLVLDIWDTAGQETYKSLTKYFYKGAKMAVLFTILQEKNLLITSKVFGMIKSKNMEMRVLF